MNLVYQICAEHDIDLEEDGDNNTTPNGSTDDMAVDEDDDIDLNDLIGKKVTFYWL